MKKVNFLCLIMLGLFFVACHSNDDTWGDWSRGYPFSGRPRTGAVTFTLNGEVYVGLGRNEDVEEKDKYLTVHGGFLSPVFLHMDVPVQWHSSSVKKVIRWLMSELDTVNIWVTKHIMTIFILSMGSVGVLLLLLPYRSLRIVRMVDVETVSPFL